VVTVDDVRAVLARLPRLRFHWVEAWLDALDADEMRELVLDARRMIVPQRVAREVLGPPTGPLGLYFLRSGAAASGVTWHVAAKMARGGICARVSHVPGSTFSAR
jgi:hypothetical protein